MDQESFRRGKGHPTPAADASGQAGERGDDVGRWELVKLLPSQILVDHRYQRPLDSRHVRSIAKEFDPTLFGVANVSLRTDGAYYALDGQHRCKAAVEAGHDKPLWFHVHRGLTIADEAQLFKELNSKTKAISAVAMFNAMVVAKDPVCCAIVKIVHSFALTVAGRLARAEDRLVSRASRSLGAIRVRLPRRARGRVRRPKATLYLGNW